MNQPKNRDKIFFTLLAVIFMLAGMHCTSAQAGVVRDTEIERTLSEWSAPIFKAAKLKPESVKMILIQNDSVNAFVAGGANIFFYTGLLAKTENPGEAIGVIAHETGHISGGHLIKTREALERASYESIISTIIGVGAAIATGDASAVPGVALGGQSIAHRAFLAHSRMHESSADQAAVTFLEKSGLDPTGIQTFLEKLESESYMPVNQQSEYVRTHPLTSNRIEAVKHRIRKSPFKNRKFPAKWMDQHKRMKAKLIAFTNPGKVPWVYSDADKTIPARYARAIAAYRNNHVDSALKQVDELLSVEPKNPFFLELKAQMLVDFSRLDDAIPVYRKAIRILPDASLFRVSLAHALIETSSQKPVLDEAIKELKQALRNEPRMPRIYRLLATAYGKTGDHDQAKINLAEEAVLQRRYDYAKEHAKAVINKAKPGSPIAIKAQDILTFIENAKKG